jgi:hypothetical protein
MSMSVKKVFEIEIEVEEDALPIDIEHLHEVIDRERGFSLISLSEVADQSAWISRQKKEIEDLGKVIDTLIGYIDQIPNYYWVYDETKGSEGSKQFTEKLEKLIRAYKKDQWMRGFNDLFQDT